MAITLGICCHRYGAGGGMERYFRDLAAALAGLADAPALRVYAPKVDAAQAEAARRAGIVPVRLSAGRWPRLLRPLVLARQLARRRGEFDLLISGVRMPAADIAICGGTHRGYLAGTGKAARWRDRVEIGREIAHYAAARVIVAHSRKMRDELTGLYGIAAERIATIHPPVDTARFGPVEAAQREALRARFGFDERPVFLFVSTGHRRKGFDLVCDAIERRRGEALLAVAGRPVGRSSPVLRELGYCNDMPDLYRAADFTVLAPSYEPFGLVGVESILCGTPLLFAAGAGCLEVIELQAVQLFDHASAAGLDAALDAALAAWRSGASRLHDPRGALRYDPALSTHAAALMSVCNAALGSAAGTGAVG